MNEREVTYSFHERPTLFDLLPDRLCDAIEDGGYSGKERGFEHNYVTTTSALLDFGRSVCESLGVGITNWNTHDENRQLTGQFQDVGQWKVADVGVRVKIQLW